jgi:hypothetical protein
VLVEEFGQMESLVTRGSRGRSRMTARISGSSMGESVADWEPIAGMKDFVCTESKRLFTDGSTPNGKGKGVDGGRQNSLPKVARGSVQV